MPWPLSVTTACLYSDQMQRPSKSCRPLQLADAERCAADASPSPDADRVAVARRQAAREDVIYHWALAETYLQDPALQNSMRCADLCTWPCRPQSQRTASGHVVVCHHAIDRVQHMRKGFLTRGRPCHGVATAGPSTDLDSAGHLSSEVTVYGQLSPAAQSAKRSGGLSLVLARAQRRAWSERRCAFVRRPRREADDGRGPAAQRRGGRLHHRRHQLQQVLSESVRCLPQRKG